GSVRSHLVDAVAIGEIFSSPTANSFYDAFKAADGGKGVACLYGNYAGDNMNVKMAIKMAEKQGLKIRTVVANDDVPSAPKAEREKRRGVAGEILMWKVGGAKGIQVRFNFVGNYFTSLEMMGVTLTLMRLDDELKACLAYPCRAIGLTVTKE